MIRRFVLHYVDPATKEKYRVDQFAPASQRINAMMPRMLQAIKHNELLRRKLFQVDFLSTLSGELPISLYHKPLDATWEAEAKQLKQSLSTEVLYI